LSTGLPFASTVSFGPSPISFQSSPRSRPWRARPRMPKRVTRVPSASVNCSVSTGSAWVGSGAMAAPLLGAFSGAVATVGIVLSEPGVLNSASHSE
jgi:hypothetical protein